MHAVVRSDQELHFLLPASHWLAGQQMAFLVHSNDAHTELRVVQCHVFHEVRLRLV